MARHSRREDEWQRAETEQLTTVPRWRNACFYTMGTSRAERRLRAGLNPVHREPAHIAVRLFCGGCGGCKNCASHGKAYVLTAFASLSICDRHELAEASEAI